MIPLTLIMEISFIVIAFLLMEYGNIGHVAAMGFLMFDILIVTTAQVYILDNTAAPVALTLAYSSTIQGYWVFGLVMLEFLVLERWFTLTGRDTLGRRQD